MIQLGKCRCSVRGILFTIPEGFYFDSNPAFAAENLMSLLAPSGSYHVNFHLTSSTRDSLDELQQIIRDCGNRPLVFPEPVIIGGFNGHYAVFESDRHQYYELHLKIGNDGVFNSFEFTITTCKNDIMQIMQTSEFADLLDGIEEAPL